MGRPTKNIRLWKNGNVFYYRLPGMTQAQTDYHVPFLQRYEGVPYHQILKEVSNLWSRQEILLSGARRVAVADATGVGPAGIEGLRREYRITVTAVWVTDGEVISERPGELTLPKSEVLILLISLV